MRVRAVIPAFLFRREGTLFLLVVGLVLAAGLYVYLSRPTTLIVAVGPASGPEQKLFHALADQLAREKRNVRLQLRTFEDVRDSAAALGREADLAVARTDVLMPENGLTVAVLRDEGVVVLAPEGGSVKGLPDLGRKRLGVVTRHDADLPLVQQVLAYYDLRASKAESGAGTPAAGAVALVALRPQDVVEAFESKRVDAVAVIATPSGNASSDLVRAVEVAARGRKVTVLGAEEGEALVQRMPALQSLTLPAGLFGGRPKRPAEDVKTVGVSYRLVARANLDREVVSTLTQHLFEMRARLVAATPSANLLRAPDFDSAVTATSARLPNHPGAVDYFQREQLTFFQRYGDWIYLLMFMGGSIGSAFVWLGQRLAKKRRALVDVVLDRLLDVLAEARDASSAEALDDLAVEIDRLVTHAVRYARHRTTDAHTMSALVIAIDAARAAIADRRAVLAGARASEGDEARAPPRDGALPEGQAVKILALAAGAGR